VANFEFVQIHASLKFPLMPEVNLRKGQTYRLLGQDAVAAKEFTEAIQLKPDYTPAYAALFDFYMDLDDIAEAEAILAKGLVHAPQSKILLQKKLELESRQSRN
jgi:tetratricopeptide (TPR) repeat protein